MLSRLTLSHFRNHAATTLTGTARFNLLTGDNGAGKTNILEAISLLAPGRGLRRAALAEMAAQAGPGGFAISAALAARVFSSQMVSSGDPETTANKDSIEAQVRLGTGTAPDQPGRRLVRVNGAEAPAAQLGEWLAISWLTPAMDRLFADTPGARRRFLDRLVLALDPAHAGHAARYAGALSERNRLLQAECEPEAAWFGAVEAAMAEAGAAVAAARVATVTALNAALAQAPPSPFAQPLLTIAPAAPADADALADALAASRGRCRAAQRSLVGPHRDDLAVTMAATGQHAALCSTGEQKAMLIAIILAHGTLIDGGGPGGETVRPRLLLLDEVAAHLDPLRRQALFSRLAEGRAQVWMTGTEAAPFAEVVPYAAHWRVSGGSVERV